MANSRLSKSTIPKPPDIPSNAFAVPAGAPDSVVQRITTIKMLSSNIRDIHWAAHKRGTLIGLVNSASLILVHAMLEVTSHARTASHARAASDPT
jgi:hypothetical protein